MNGSVLALLAIVCLGASFLFWFQRIREVRTGEVRGLMIGAMGVTALLALGAFAAGVGGLGKIGAGIALGLSGVFLLLQPLSGQSREAPTVGVGDAMLAFSAPDDAGGTFSSASLAGKPYLLKFFRGHW